MLQKQFCSSKCHLPTGIAALSDCTQETEPASSNSHFHMEVLSRAVPEITNKNMRLKERLLIKKPPLFWMSLKCIFATGLIFRRWECVFSSRGLTAGDSAFCKTRYTHIYMCVYIYISTQTYIHRSLILCFQVQILWLMSFCIQISHDTHLHNTRRLNKHMVLLIAQRCYFPYNRCYLPLHIECLP